MTMKILAWEGGKTSINGLTVISETSAWSTVVLATNDKSGKHYFEVELQATSNLFLMGLFSQPYDSSSGLASYYWYRSDYRGGCYASPGGSVSCTGYSTSENHRLMCAYDFDAGKIWFGNDGTWVNSGDPSNGTNPQYSNLGTYFGRPGIQAYGVLTAQFITPENNLYLPSGFSAPTDLDMIGKTTAALRADTAYGGALKIVEPVTRLNAPVSRRVRLCDQLSGRVVREAWSDAETGDVTFDHLSAGPWVLYSLDHTHEFEAVAISDRLATADGERP